MLSARLQQARTVLLRWVARLDELVTVPHAVTAVLALAGIICFSVSLVYRKAFEGTLSAIFVLLCRFVIYQLSARMVLKQELLAALGTGAHAVAPTTSCKGLRPAEVFGDLQERDAEAREVSERAEPELGEVLLTALAKEYLRVKAAIRSYEEHFGVKEVPEPRAQPATSADLAVEHILGPEACAILAPAPPSHTLIAGSAASVGSCAAAEPSPSRRGSPARERCRPAPLLSLGLEGEVDMALDATASTPRSPPGPPSPEGERRRRMGVVQSQV